MLALEAGQGCGRWRQAEGVGTNRARLGRAVEGGRDEAGARYTGHHPPAGGCCAPGPADSVAAAPGRAPAGFPAAPPGAAAAPAERPSRLPALHSVRKGGAELGGARAPGHSPNPGPNRPHTHAALHLNEPPALGLRDPRLSLVLRPRPHRALAQLQGEAQGGHGGGRGTGLGTARGPLPPLAAPPPPQPPPNPPASAPGAPSPPSRLSRLLVLGTVWRPHILLLLGALVSFLFFVLFCFAF